MLSPAAPTAASSVMAAMPPPLPPAALLSPAAPGSMSQATPTLALERVLGNTTFSSATFAVNPATGDIATAAGCVIVLYSPQRNKTARFFRARQPINCLAFSQDGDLLVAGGKPIHSSGSNANAACLTLWSVTGGNQLWEVTSAHNEGVACVRFSPDKRFIVSVGFAKDRALHAWECCSSVAGPSDGANAAVGGNFSLRRIASGRISQKVLSLAFHSSGRFFVTAGEKHLKFWPTDSLLALPKGAAQPGVIVLSSKPGIMSEGGPEFETFVDVACSPPPSASQSDVRAASHGNSHGNNAVYALTSAGMLCSFDGEERIMEHWVNLKVRHAFSLEIGTTAASSASSSSSSASSSPSHHQQLLFVGCSDGIVRVFSPSSLQFKGVLPAPPSIGRGNVTCLDSSAAIAPPQAGEVYPAALAVRHCGGCSAGGGRELVAVVYGDRSLIVWDLTDFDSAAQQQHHNGSMTSADALSPVSSASTSSRVTKFRSLVAHSGPIWDVAAVPSCPLLKEGNASSSSASSPCFPPGSFVTASGDSTLRFWNLNPKSTYTRKEASAYQKLQRQLTLLQQQQQQQGAATSLMSPEHQNHAVNSSVASVDDSVLAATGSHVAGERASASVVPVTATGAVPAAAFLLSAVTAAGAPPPTPGGLMRAPNDESGHARTGSLSASSPLASLAGPHQLLPGARPKNAYLRDQLLVLYADQEQDDEGEQHQEEEGLDGGDGHDDGEDYEWVNEDVNGEQVPRQRRRRTYRSGPGYTRRRQPVVFGAGSWPAGCVVNTPFNTEVGPFFPLDKGLRCVSVSGDGRHVAAGDRCGNIRVYDCSASASTATTSTSTASPSSAPALFFPSDACGQLAFLEVAHDQEVMSVAYAPFSGSGFSSSTTGSANEGEDRSKLLLATGSRDRIVHVFSSSSSCSSPSSCYDVLTSMGEHVEAVSAVRFGNDDTRLVTTSSDGAVVFWKCSTAAGGATTVTKLKATKSSAGPVLDACIDATNKTLLTVGQGDGISLWSMRTGRVTKTISCSAVATAGSDADSSSPSSCIRYISRVAMDPSGLFIAAAASDNSVRIFDCFTGQCLASSSGHGMPITGLLFLHDCRRLVTVSLDGCIFVWRLSPLLTKAMVDRLKELGKALATTALSGTTTTITPSGPTSRPATAASPSRPPTSLAASGSSNPLTAAVSTLHLAAEIALSPATAALAQAAYWCHLAATSSVGGSITAGITTGQLGIGSGSRLGTPLLPAPAPLSAGSSAVDTPAALPRTQTGGFGLNAAADPGVVLDARQQHGHATATASAAGGGSALPPRVPSAAAGAMRVVPPPVAPPAVPTVIVPTPKPTVSNNQDETTSDHDGLNASAPSSAVSSAASSDYSPAGSALVTSPTLAAPSSSLASALEGAALPMELRQSVLPAWVRNQWGTAAAVTTTTTTAAAAVEPQSQPQPQRSKWASMMTASVANFLPATTAEAAAAMVVGGAGGGGNDIKKAGLSEPLLELSADDKVDLEATATTTSSSLSDDRLQGPLHGHGRGPSDYSFTTAPLTSPTVAGGAGGFGGGGGAGVGAAGTGQKTVFSQQPPELLPVSTGSFVVESPTKKRGQPRGAADEDANAGGDEEGAHAAEGSGEGEGEGEDNTVSSSPLRISIGGAAAEEAVNAGNTSNLLLGDIHLATSTPPVLPVGAGGGAGLISVPAVAGGIALAVAAGVQGAGMMRQSLSLAFQRQQQQQHQQQQPGVMGTAAGGSLLTGSAGALGVGLGLGVGSRPTTATTVGGAHHPPTSKLGASVAAKLQKLAGGGSGASTPSYLLGLGGGAGAGGSMMLGGTASSSSAILSPPRRGASDLPAGAAATTATATDMPSSVNTSLNSSAHGTTPSKGKVGAPTAAVTPSGAAGNTSSISAIQGVGGGGIGIDDDQGYGNDSFDTTEQQKAVNNVGATGADRLRLSDTSDLQALLESARQAAAEETASANSLIGSVIKAPASVAAAARRGDQRRGSTASSVGSGHGGSSLSEAEAALLALQGAASRLLELLGSAAAGGGGDGDLDQNRLKTAAAEIGRQLLKAAEKQ